MTEARRLPESILRIAAAIGLGISGILLYEYLRPASGVCGEGGGCDVVRHSKYAYPLGIPTPVFGLVFFAGAVILSFLRRRALLLAWTLGGAAAALFFFYVQAVELKSWCKYCVVADAAALVVALSAVALRRAEPSSGKSAIAMLPIMSFVAAGAFFAPVMVNRIAAGREGPAHGLVTVDDKLPEMVAREQRPGVVTIVEVLDFECPHCRKLHGRLEKILPEYGDKVRVVRKMLPLSIHVHAEQAARAYCCADDVGKADEMANALMHTDNLTVAGCEKIAAQLGIDLASFRECLQDRRTAERIKTETAEARAAGIRGLPTFWIGKQRFSGAAGEEQIRAAIDTAMKESGG